MAQRIGASQWSWRELLFAVTLVGANALIVAGLVDPSYRPFSWQAFAQVYEPPANAHGVDSDGDGIPDMHDPNPTTPNASGCFYDPNTGRIHVGGMLAVNVSNGSGGLVDSPPVTDGCFLIKLDQAGQQSAQPATQSATVTIEVITPPTGCALIDDCPFDGTFLATSSAQADILGALEDFSNPGFLTSPGCTESASTVVLFQTSVGVLANNIAVDCTAPAPLLSLWTTAALVLLLAAAGTWAVRRRGPERA